MREFEGKIVQKVTGKNRREGDKGHQESIAEIAHIPIIIFSEENELNETQQKDQIYFFLGLDSSDPIDTQKCQHQDWIGWKNTIARVKQRQVDSFQQRLIEFSYMVDRQSLTIHTGDRCSLISSNDG